MFYIFIIYFTFKPSEKNVSKGKPFDTFFSDGGDMKPLISVMAMGEILLVNRFFRLTEIYF